MDSNDLGRVVLSAVGWFLVYPPLFLYFPAFSTVGTLVTIAWWLLTPVLAYALGVRLALRPARLAVFVVAAYLVAVPIASGLRAGVVEALPLWPSLLLRTGLALASVAAAVWLAVRLPVPRLREAS